MSRSSGGGQRVRRETSCSRKNSLLEELAPSVINRARRRAIKEREVARRRAQESRRSGEKLTNRKFTAGFNHSGQNNRLLLGF